MNKLVIKLAIIVVKWAKIFGMHEGGSVNLKLNRLLQVFSSNLVIIMTCLPTSLCNPVFAKYHYSLLDFVTSLCCRLLTQVLLSFAGPGYDCSDSLEHLEAQYNKNGSN